jgi:hypothetical protein
MSNNADASLLRTVRRAVPSLSWPAIERATREVFQEFEQIGDRQDDSFRVSLRNLVGDCAVKSRAAWEAVRRLAGVPEASRLGCAHSAAPVPRRQLHYLLRHGRRRPVLPRRLARTLTAERPKIQSSKVIRRTGHGQAKRADA